MTHLILAFIKGLGLAVCILALLLVLWSHLRPHVDDVRHPHDTNTTNTTSTTSTIKEGGT